MKFKSLDVSVNVDSVTISMSMETDLLNDLCQSTVTDVIKEPMSTKFFCVMNAILERISRDWDKSLPTDWMVTMIPSQLYNEMYVSIKKKTKLPKLNK